MPSFNDIARKAVGDFSDEFPEAAYRAVASNLANSFLTIVNEAAKKQQNEDVKSLMDNQIVRLFEGPVLSFGLAFLLELLPSETLLPAQRRRLAYNLRVHAYQGIDDKLLSFAGGGMRTVMGVIEGEVSKAVTAMTAAKEVSGAMSAAKPGFRRRTSTKNAHQSKDRPRKKISQAA
jgi:hypothetical protein